MDADHVEGQTADSATGAESQTGHPNPDPAPAVAPAAPRRKRRKRAKRSRPRPVAPAEPGERAAAAASALADLGPAPVAPGSAPGGEATPGDPGAERCGECGGGPGECPGHEAAPDADALAALAEASEPVLRVAIRGVALAIRRRFPGGAAGLYAKAEGHAAMLAGTVGARLAARLGPALPVLAIVAELAEPFLADRWNAGGAK